MTMPHKGVELYVVELENKIKNASDLIEKGLLGTEPRRRIWTDADYLCAALATLSGDGSRARTALTTRHSLPPMDTWPENQREAAEELAGYVRAHLSGNKADPELKWALEQWETAKEEANDNGAEEG